MTMTYKLKKENNVDLIAQLVVFFILIIGIIYTLFTIDYDVSVVVYSILFIFLFLGMFISVWKNFQDKKEIFIEIDIQDDKAVLPSKTVFFKDIDGFVLLHHLAYGNYYGSIYTVVAKKRELCLYSREFSGNNFLDEESTIEIFTNLDKAYKKYRQS